MLYNPDIYFIKTLTGFMRISKESFNEINYDYAHTHVVNKDANYDLNVHIKPSFLFYTFHKNEGETMWKLLADKWYTWFNKKLRETGFDYYDVSEETPQEQGE